MAGDDVRESITLEMDVMQSLRPRTHEAFALYVLEGAVAGAVVTLDQDSLVVGRSLDANLRLDDEGVSRLHARFELGAASVTLVDLGSRNGTFVNGERILEPRGLLDGDQIAIGLSVIRFAVQTAAEIELAQDVYDASIRDHLTGLYNRRHAQEQLARAMRSWEQGYRSLCMLHVDGLDNVNKSIGRSLGDALLRAVAGKLQDVLGEDDLIARWDGAQLLVLSREPEPEALGSRLRALVASVDVPAHEGVLNTTASAGVIALKPGAGVRHALEQAEQALHDALRAGGGHIAVRGDDELGEPNLAPSELTQPFDAEAFRPRST